MLGILIKVAAGVAVLGIVTAAALPGIMRAWTDQILGPVEKSKETEDKEEEK